MMRYIIFSLILAGCISKRTDNNYKVNQTYQMFNIKAIQDSNYYQFDRKGRLNKVVTFHDLSKMKSVVEFSKHGKLISEKLYQKDTIYYEVIYHRDKYNSIKNTISYLNGKKNGSFGYYKLDSSNQKIPIFYSNFLYQNNLLKLSEKFIGKHGENLQFCRSLENLVVFGTINSASTVSRLPTVVLKYLESINLQADKITFI